MTPAFALGLCIILTAIVAYLWGYSAGSQRDLPVKRTNDLLTESTNLRISLRTIGQEAINYRAALIDIRNSLAGQKSGTAIRIHRAVVKALKR